MFNNTCQVDSRFNAGVTAANYRNTLTFKQRTITVRAIGYTFGAILIFARNVHVAPFRAGGDDNATCFQHRAGGCFNLMQTAFLRCRDQFACALAVDHIDIIIINVCFQRTCQFLTFSFRY